MADDHANGLAHELPDRGEFTLEVEPIGPVEIDGLDDAKDDARRDRPESLDPVRLYLRQAARSRLLDREEEISIARRIDDGRRERIAALLGSPLGLRWLLDLPGALCDGTVEIGTILADHGDEETPWDAEQARRRLLRQITRLRPVARRGAGARSREERPAIARAVLALGIADEHIDALGAELARIGAAMERSVECDGAAPRALERECGLTRTSLRRLLDRVQDAERRAQLARQELVEA